MARSTDQEQVTTLQSEVLRFLNGLDSPPRSILVALSGGPDSSALLHALVTLPGNTIVIRAAHVNHHLRGERSDGDERWCRDFCNSLDVPLTVLDGALDPDEVRDRGVEAAARTVRYRLLEAERLAGGSDTVATAHTRSDQAETVLSRLLTGRGTWRLSGIVPVVDRKLIRPLLTVSRTDVMNYLADRGIEPRHDESNDDGRFLRNRIRNELLPMIAAWNPRIEELLADTASLELDRSRAFDELLEPLRRQVITESESAATITLQSGLSSHVARTLLLQQIRRLDPDTREVDSDTLIALTEAKDSSSCTVSPRLRARREGDAIQLEITEPPPASDPYQVPIRPGETVRIAEAGYEISLREAQPDDLLASPDRLRQVIQVAPGLDASFVIRSRKPGDRFRPLGMDRDKNLADFLIDRRIRIEERDSLPLLVCNGSIVWVAGVEVGDEVKVTPTPGRRLEIVAKRLEEVA